MSKKKIIIGVVSAVVASIAIFISIDYSVKKMNDKRNSNSNSNIESNSNSNEIEIITKKAEVIDYDKYEELRIDKDETFAIIIMKSEDETCNTFKEEVLTTFNNKKSKVYELDVDKLDEEEVSEVISDITDIQHYKEATMITPTMIVSKKGKIVYVQEGLAYSTEINEKLSDKDIE